MTGRARAFRAGLIVCSTLGALALAEAAVRVAKPQNLSGWWMVPHASGLILNKPGGTARHQFGNTTVVYRFGARHNRVSTRSGTAADRRILVVGDSLTFGWLVPDGATFTDLLQARYPNEEWINAAVGGWGTSDQVKFVELFCDSLRPSDIYVFANSYDIERSVGRGLYRLTGGSLEGVAPVPNRELKFLLNRIPFYGWLVEHSHLAALGRAAWLGAGSRTAATAAAMADRTDSNTAFAFEAALFKELAAKARACGARVVVLYIGWHQSAQFPGRASLRFFEEAAVSGLFAGLGIEFASLGRSPALAAVHADRARHEIAEDGHPNPAGARQIYLAAADVLDARRPAESR